VKRTSRRLAAAAGLGVVLLSGCGNGSQVRAGAAALVGDQRISDSDLAARVDRGLADPAAAQQLGADRVGYQRQVLSRMVNADLLEAAARDKGVVVTEGQVDARIAQFATQAGGQAQLQQQAAQGGIAAADLRQVIRGVVLQEALGDAVTADLPAPDASLRAAYQANLAQYDRVRTSHILVAGEALARRLLAEVKADPSTFAAKAKQFSTDTGSKDNGGDLGFVGRGELVKEYEDAAFAGKDGTFVLAHSQFGWHVISVVAHQTRTYEQAVPELRRTVLAEQRTARLQALVAETSRKLGVKVNPRFGRWDATASAVAAVDQGPGSVSSPGPGAPVVPADRAPAS
jgi:foldase protein PrsA